MHYPQFGDPNPSDSFQILKEHFRNMYRYLLALALVAVAFGKVVPGANLKHPPSNAGDWDCVFCEVVVSALEEPENRGDADKAEAVCSFLLFLEF